MARFYMVASYVYASYSYHFQTYPRIADLKMDIVLQSNCYNCSTFKRERLETRTESPKVPFPLATTIAWYFDEALVQG